MSDKLKKNKDILSEINKKIPKYAGHAINRGVQKLFQFYLYAGHAINHGVPGQVVGSASVSTFFVAGSAGLFGAVGNIMHDPLRICVI